MRLRCTQPCGNRGVAVSVAVKLHADGLARGRVLPSAYTVSGAAGASSPRCTCAANCNAASSARSSSIASTIHASASTHCGPRRKIQSPGGPIAAHLHVVHRRHGIDGQARPRPSGVAAGAARLRSARRRAHPGARASRCGRRRSAPPADPADPTPAPGSSPRRRDLEWRHPPRSSAIVGTRACALRQGRIGTSP